MKAATIGSVFLFSVCGAVLLDVQNNFEKKKREIADEINALTEEALDIAKRVEDFGKKKKEIADTINALAEDVIDVEKQEDEALKIAKRAAESQVLNFERKKRDVLVELLREKRQNTNPHGFGFGLVQDCKGGNCRQANAGGFGNVQKCQGAGCRQANTGGFGHVQDCRGSQCGQLNSRGKREELVREKRQNTNPHGFNFGLVQDCKGGNCRQANAGGFGNVQKCQGAGCQQANTGGFGHVQDCRGSQCGQLNRGKREEAVHTLTCAGDVTSMCKGKDCVVSCSDGGQISLVCEDEIVDVNSDSDSGNVEARCGSAKEIKEKIQAFRSLFPFL